MKKVLILYTGGTIGMDYTAHGLAVIPGLFRSQLKMLFPVANVSLDLIEYPNPIDSSDISEEYWIQMVNDIATNYRNYSGFVIIHGTDTMAYTASILSFALYGLSKPVILTGSQLPLVHRRSDGWNNLIDAIYSATQPELHEVAIAFNHKLFRGCRAQKVSTNRFLGFDSVDEEPLATFGIEIAWYKKRWWRTTAHFKPIVPQKAKVLLLSFCPGYTIDFIAETLASNIEVQGVVIETYGSGNIPLHNQKLIVAIKAAVARGVIILNITQVIEGRISNKYSNSRLSHLGIIGGYDMTPEAALAKLTILLSQNLTKTEIELMLATNLVGELTKPE